MKNFENKRLFLKSNSGTVQGFSLISLANEVFTKATNHIVY